MSFKLKSLKKRVRNGVLLGAKVFCEDSKQLIEDEKGKLVPAKEVREYGALGLKFAKPTSTPALPKFVDAKKKPTDFEASFKKMLLGDGSVAKPKGEIGLLLNELNKVSTSVVESDF